MKKLTLMAVCAVAVMAGCNNKGNTSPIASEERDDSITITADNIVEPLDTVAHPMFLGRYQDGGPLQVLYWTEVKMNEEASDSKEYVESWTLQDHFRRNVRRYTNLIVADKTIKV